jgi:AcrR family transcriptional regulator
MEPIARKPRTDALRNRERLLEAAKHAFTSLGVEISLDDVAKAAGLGVGTLYRHFPTRDSLLEAVYKDGVAQLAEAARRLAEERPPLDALRDWMRLFVDYIAMKNVIAPALNCMVGGSSEIFAETGKQVKKAIGDLVERAAESGDIRKDLDPLDLLRALVGVANVASSPDWEASAKRLVDILIKGSRPEE